MKPIHGSSWCFVPDSAVSYEEDKKRCKECTAKYGKIIPRQFVNLEMCCGIVDK